MAHHKVYLFTVLKGKVRLAARKLTALTLCISLVFGTLGKLPIPSLNGDDGDCLL